MSNEHYEISFIIDNVEELCIKTTDRELRNWFVETWKWKAWNEGFGLEIRETMHCHPIWHKTECRCKEETVKKINESLKENIGAKTGADLE